MNQRIYHINAEVKPTRNETFDPNEIAGAAVRCLVPASDPDHALAMLLSKLKDHGLELVMTEWVVDFYESEWENPNDNFEKELAEEAERLQEVVFGTFHTWPHDAIE